MRTNKGILAYFMLTATVLLLAMSSTSFADSFTNLMATALSVLLSLMTVLVLLFARSNQKARPVSFMSKARAPCETFRNIRTISKKITFGISVKERLTKTICLSSPWRQDHGRVARC